MCLNRKSEQKDWNGRNIKMLTLELSDVKEFKNIIITSELILNEIKFEADSEGLRFCGLDGSHVSYFNVEFGEDYFISYSLTEPETIIIDTAELLKIIKRIKNTDSVTLTIDNFYLTITAYNGRNEKLFKVNAVDMEYNTPPMPNVPFSVETVVDFADLRDSVGDVKLYSDLIELNTNDKRLTINTNGVIGEYVSNLVVDNQLDDVSSKFSVGYIEKFFKLNGVSDDVIFRLGDDMPMMMSIRKDDLSIDYLIAPRISEE